jgi:hypothetical protein
VLWHVSDAVQQQPVREERLPLFEVNELEAMEDISNTSLLADYFARRRGALLVDVPHLEDLDRVDLFIVP